MKHRGRVGSVVCKRRWCLPEDENLHLQNKEELFMKEKEQQ
jgi:hypothetical protein